MRHYEDQSQHKGDSHTDEEVRGNTYPRDVRLHGAEHHSERHVLKEAPYHERGHKSRHLEVGWAKGANIDEGGPPRGHGAWRTARGTMAARVSLAASRIIPLEHYYKQKRGDGS